MKTTQNFFCFTLLLAIGLAPVPCAFATSATWAGGTSGLWSLSANWSGAPATVPGTGDTATFNAASSYTTLDLGSGVTIGNLYFDTASAAAYTIGSGSVGSQALTLNNSGAIGLSSTATANQLVNANLTLGNSTAAQSFTLGATNSAATLTIAGTVTHSSTGSAYDQIKIGGAGNTTISGAIGGPSGLIYIDKYDAGTATISGYSTFIGSVAVHNGTMVISSVDTAGTGSGAWMTAGDTASQNGILKIQSPANFTRYNLALGLNATGPGAVYHSGGTLTLAQVASTADLQIGEASGYGYYNLSGGTLVANEVDDGGSFSASTGVMDVSGGTLTDSGYLIVARGTTTSSGLFNMTGGTATATRIEMNWAASSGAISILNIGGGSGSAAVTTTASTSLGLSLDNGNNTGTIGIANLLANGTLTTGIVQGRNANPTDVLNFNGGTLKANIANTSFMTSGNIDGVYVYPNGGTIDNGGNAITISRPLLAPTSTGVSSISGPTTAGSGYIGAPLVTITGGTYTAPATAYAVMADDGSGKTYKVSSIVVTSPGVYSSTTGIGVTLTGGGYGATAASGFTINTAGNTSGGMTFADSGAAATTTLSGANTYTGATLVNGGTLEMDSANATSASVTVNSGGTLALNIGDALGFTASKNVPTINSGGTINNITSASRVTLWNGLTMTGGTLTGASTINDGNGEYSLSGTVTATSDGSGTAATMSGTPISLQNQNVANGTVTFNVTRGSATPASDLTVSAKLIPNSNAANVGLTKSGNGIMTLSGVNTYTGGTTLNGGTLVLGNASALGTGALTWGSSSALLQLRSDSDVTFTGGNSMAGLGNATMNIDVNQVNSGNNNHTLTFGPSGFSYGSTIINVTGGNGYTLSLGTLTSVAYTGLTLNPTTANLTVAGIVNGGQPVAVSGSGNTTISGVISGSGALTKSGTGTLTLNGVNTYTGNTTINNSGGTLKIGSAGQLNSGSYSGNISIGSSSTFNYNSSAAQTLSGTISGSGTLQQSGPGTLTISGALNAPTTVAGGALAVTSTQTGTGGVTVNDGASLNVTVASGTQWAPTSFHLGNGTAGCALGFFSVATSATPAPINPGLAVVVNSGDTVTVNIYSVGGSLAVGNYPLLANTGLPNGDVTTTYSLGAQPPGVTAGKLTASGGVLYYTITAVADIWGVNTPGGNWNQTSANWTGNSTIFHNGDNALFNDSVTGPNTVTVADNVTAGTITVNNSSTAYTIVSDGTHSISGGSLTKTGNGTLTLSSANSYSSGTTLGSAALSGGTLKINNSGALGSGALTIYNGTIDNTSSGDETLTAIPQNWNGSFTYTGSANNLNLGSGAVTLNTTPTVTVSAKTLEVDGQISGSYGLTKAGGGTLSLAGNNNFNGGTTLSAGQLNINNNSAVGSGALTISSGTIDNTGAADVTLGTIAQNWNGSFTYAGSAHNLNLGSGAVTLGASPTVTVSANTLTVGGAISGSGFSLTKAGSGTLTLSGGNSYTGSTTVSAGTLVLSGNNTSATGATTVSGTLQLQNANALAGSALTLNSGGTLNLRADADTTFTPASIANISGTTTTINADQITSGNGGHKLTLSGSFYINGGATLNVSSGNSDTLALSTINLNAGSSTETVSAAASSKATVAGVQAYGVYDTLAFAGAGNIDVLGAMNENTSPRWLGLTFNQSGTATVWGANNLTTTGNGNVAYTAPVTVNSGVTVLNNSSALSSSGGNGIVFNFGASSGSGSATLLLGGTDASGLAGGITMNPHLFYGTVSVRDTTSGTLTIGGQNTSGVNTWGCNFTLGSSANTGKSVTLLAATGGEVDFTGAFLLNSGDTSAGITVNDGTHAGLVKLAGANTYPGNTTLNAGTLQLGNDNVLPSGTTLNRTGGTVDMNGKNNTVNAFQVSGTVKAKGTWGSTASSATHKNNTYFTSASAGVLTVTTGGATTTTLAAGGTSTYGDSVAFTATVVGSGGDGTTPSGTVTFYDNGTAIGTGSLSGSGLTATATLNSTALAAGTHNNITATYGGSDSYDVSTTASAITQVVNPLAVQLTGSRVYDGTATAAAAILSVGNKVGSDTVTVASGSATLASANGGLQTITDFSGLTLGNNSAGNYTLTSASGSVRINPAPGTFAITTTTNKPAAFPTYKIIYYASDAGVTLSVSAVTASGNGSTVLLNGNNTITYTPKTDSTAADSFTYTLADGVGGSSTGTVTVTVNGINKIDLSIALVDGVPTVTASGIRNQTYDLQISDDSGATWSHHSVTAADNGVIIYPDTDWGSHQSRVYRLAQP